MELSVYNIKGEDTGRKITLNDEVFALQKPNDHAIYLAVKLYLANQRQGTHKAKERSEISGSTRKLFRQKGTGGARRGDINSPLLRGGARVFGPRPRSYGFKLNKKLLRLAKISALTYKAQNGEIVVLENFSMDTPKTKEFVQVKKSLGIDGKKALFVMNEVEPNIRLSARNIPDTYLLETRKLNTYQILNTYRLVLSEDAVKEINETFSV